MPVRILDGTGKGNEAQVDDNNRLRVASLALGALAGQSFNGDAFYLVTGFIPLTSTGVFSGIFTFQNTSPTRQLRIHQLRTCGTVIQEWRLISRPTAGTLITGGTLITPLNLNLGSANAFQGTARFGANALTVTDGTVMAQWINNIGHSNTDLEGGLIVPPNARMALTCKPAAAGDVCVSILAAYHDQDAVQ